MGIPPEQADFCPTCSMVGDHINTDFVHLAHRNVTLVAITLALVRLERPQGACLTVRRLVILEGIFVAMVSCVIDRGYSCSSSQQW